MFATLPASATIRVSFLSLPSVCFLLVVRARLQQRSIVKVDQRAAAKMLSHLQKERHSNPDTVFDWFKRRKIWATTRHEPRGMHHGMYGDVQNACAPGGSRLVAGPEGAAPGRRAPPSAVGAGLRAEKLQNKSEFVEPVNTDLGWFERHFGTVTFVQLGTSRLNPRRSSM